MDNLRQTFFLYYWWLRDIFSSIYFASVYDNTVAGRMNADNRYGIIIRIIGG